MSPTGIALIGDCFTSSNDLAEVAAEVADDAIRNDDPAAGAVKPNGGGRDASRDVPGQAQGLCREHHS